MNTVQTEVLAVDGEIENAYQYDAFGVLRGSREKIHNRILYTGQQYDRISGQYYLRARYYNPVVGRFLQEDVYRGDGLNLYTYCKDNPVVYYAPSGYTSRKERVLRILMVISWVMKIILESCLQIVGN